MEFLSEEKLKKSEVFRMGTDVYLEWDKQTEKQKKKQVTGYSIDSGDVGYLRASIGMATENSFLRGIFPEKYWKSGKALRYKFTKEKTISLQKAGIIYLFSAITGKEIENPFFKEQKKSKEMVVSLFKNLGAGKSEFSMSVSKSCDFRHAVMWLNAVFNFYELGLEKEKKGLNPKVYISW